MKHRKIASILSILFFCVVASYLAAARMRQSSPGPSQMENLGRGVVAVRSATSEVFVSWRVLGTDSPDIAFNLYRSTGGGSPMLLNAQPITGATYFVDSGADLTRTNAYFVRPIVSGVERSSSASFTLPASAPVRQ